MNQTLWAFTKGLLAYLAASVSAAAVMLELLSLISPEIGVVGTIPADAGGWQIFATYLATPIFAVLAAPFYGLIVAVFSLPLTVLVLALAKILKIYSRAYFLVGGALVGAATSALFIFGDVSTREWQFGLLSVLSCAVAGTCGAYVYWKLIYR